MTRGEEELVNPVLRKEYRKVHQDYTYSYIILGLLSVSITLTHALLNSI